MQPSEQEHWLEKIKKYEQDDWSSKPSLFAEFAIGYFPAEGTLVEIGAGSGQDSVFFATKGYTVIACDVVDTGFARTQQLAKAAKVSVQQKIVDLWDPLDFSDSSVDVVYAQLSLHYFTVDQTKKIFAEIKRILKPGGILTALFNSTNDPEYGEGEEIEPEYYKVKKLRKRFFTVESAMEFAADFEILLTDDKGETYKDNAAGVTNLIRLAARKS